MDSFWSLAAYTAQDMNLIPNPARRYSVGHQPRTGPASDPPPQARQAQP